MLERCSSLDEIELLLAEYFGAAELIGELPVTEQDVSMLATHIRNCVEDEGMVPGTRTLRARAPCSVSCFLVLQGVYGYRHGDFWSAVEETIGRELPNVKSEWGQILEEVLDRFQLPRFADTGGHRYVTPILGHGGIPDYCLDDYFDKLLTPVVAGRIEYDGDIGHLLEEWQCRPSLVQFADKPVKRFLTYGGKAAQNFLERCLDMAREIIDAGVTADASQLGLPPRVVSRFQEWWQSQSSAAPHRARANSWAFRYRPAEIRLDLSASGLLVVIPRQTLSGELVRGQQPRAEIAQDARPWKTVPLQAHRHNGHVETMPAEVPVTSPFGELEVVLSAAGQRFKEWSFQGITSDCPWMAFDTRNRKLITARPLPEREFWLLSPASWNIDTASVREEAPVWRNHRARRLELDVLQELKLHDGDSQKQPALIRVDPTAYVRSRLEGGERLEWPPIHCGGHEVHVGTLPYLVVPSIGPNPSWDRLTISISQTSRDAVDQEPRRTVCIKDLLSDYPPGAQCLRIPLADPRLLGPKAVGMLTVRQRGRLGHDATFFLCPLPGLRLELPVDQLIPDPQMGPRTVAVRVTLPEQVAGIRLTEDSTGSLDRCGERDGEVSVQIPSGESKAELVLDVRRDGTVVTIPLEIQVPRVEWAISGIGPYADLRYSAAPAEITLQELEEADEPTLHARLNLGRRVKSWVVVGDDQQIEEMSLVGGKGTVSLKPLLDTIRGNKSAVQLLKLSLEIAGFERVVRVPVARIRAVWEVERVDALTEAGEGRRRLSVWWTDRSSQTNRLLRLWNYADRTAAPREVAVPDGASAAEFLDPVAAFPDGRYCLEFAVHDDWGTASFPDTYARNIRDLEIRPDDMQVQVLDSQAARLEDFLQSIECGLSVEEIATFFHARIPSLFPSRPDVTIRFCQALFRRNQNDSASDRRAENAVEVLRYVLSHAEDDESILLEALAQAALTEREAGNLALAEWCVDALVGVGALQRRWGNNLRKLFSQGIYPRSSTEIDAPRPSFAEVYERLAWSDRAIATRFLKGLMKGSGVVRHQGKQVKSILDKHERATEDDLIICRRARRQAGIPRGLEMNDTSTAFVRLERWYTVQPARETHAVSNYVTAFFQRALVWRAATCPEESYNKLESLGSEAYFRDRQAYLKELCRSESELRRHLG